MSGIVHYVSLVNGSVLVRGHASEDAHHVYSTVVAGRQ